MNKNLSKLDASNQKRLESLRQKANEFKQKKETIRHDLSNLDSTEAKSTAKRITFDSSSDSEPEEKKPKPIPSKAKPTSTAIAKRKSNNLFDDDDEDVSVTKTKNKSSTKKEKFSLIDDADDSSDADDYDAKKAIESKLNLNEKTANKLLELKSKYVNENSRFKIDDRFIESDSSESESSEDEKPVKNGASTAATGDGDDDDEEVGERPEDISEKKLKKEKAAALKILESITGKPIVARHNEAEADSKYQSKVKQMVRYDPSKDEHKIFEVKDSSDDEAGLRAKKPKEAENGALDAENGKAEELVNPEKFYKVEANIKELFESDAQEANSGFQFSFDHVEENLSKRVDKFSLEDYHDEKSKMKSMPRSLEERFKSKYSSSSESESEPEDEESAGENGMEEEEADVASFRKESSHDQSQPRRSRPLPKPTGPLPKIDHFLPREDEKDIVEALKFFCRTSEVEDLREEWQKKRAILVEECKKKHKRVLRKKSTFENKKILPWKSSSKNKK